METNSYKLQIDNLIKQWNKINNCDEWNLWADKAKSLKFGTYGTISIFDVIENTKFKFASSWVKDSFINELNLALNNFKY